MGPMPNGNTFGFHGIFNLIHFEREHEIMAFASMLPDSLARSDMVLLLLRNLVIVGQFDAAMALGHRILEADPRNEEIADAVVRSRFGLARKRAAMSRSNVGTIAGRIIQRFRTSR